MYTFFICKTLFTQWYCDVKMSLIVIIKIIHFIKKSPLNEKNKAGLVLSYNNIISSLVEPTHVRKGTE